MWACIDLKPSDQYVQCFYLSGVLMWHCIGLPSLTLNLLTHRFDLLLSKLVFFVYLIKGPYFTPKFVLLSFISMNILLPDSNLPLQACLEENRFRCISFVSSL